MGNALDKDKVLSKIDEIQDKGWGVEALNELAEAIESGDLDAEGWISVDEQPPKEGQAVIYYFSETGVHVGKYAKADPEFGEHVFYGRDGWLTDDATHWKPLPEPPKVSE